MPTLSSIQSQAQNFVKFNDLPWFNEATNCKGLAKGGIYLVSGPPGGGKTTLCLQMGIDLACQGYRILYLALEQTPSALKEIVQGRVFAHRRSILPKLPEATYDWRQKLSEIKKIQEAQTESDKEEDRIERNFFIDSSVNGMEALPDFLTRQVIGTYVPYAGTDFLFVDSIQGLGTAPTSSRPYQKLFEFNRWAKEHNIAVILVGHITKGGAIAGPRSLEHNVDCVLYMRKAMRFRPLFVPKNRFGPERFEPFTLIMDQWGCLDKSKHVKAKASRAFGYLPGIPDFIEVQALVKLPKYGDKPGIKAPYLPRQKLTQLVGIVSSLQDIDISDLTFEINCAIPGGLPYSQTLDLPLIVSMLSSYFQSPVPSGSLFVGEVDLMQAVRPVPQQVCDTIAKLLDPTAPSILARSVDKIFISETNQPLLAQKLAEVDSKVVVHGISDLQKAVEMLWLNAQ